MSTTTHQGAEGADTMTAGLTLTFDPRKLFDVVAQVGDGGETLGRRIVGIMLTSGQSSFREDLGLAFYGVTATPAPRTDGGMAAGVLWSAWSEDDCDSDPRIDPMAQKVTEWFVGRWPVGADEPECRILIGEGRSAEIIARRIADNLTSILNTDVIRARKAATPAQPAGAVPDGLREAVAKFLKQFRQAVFAEDHGAPAVLERVRDIAMGSWFDSESTRLLTLLASHPAGQSAGSGADGSDHLSTLNAMVARKLERYRANKPAPDSTRTGQGEAEDLEWLRYQIVALCEDTEERYGEAGQRDLESKQGAYARGRVSEAKSIRKAIREVVRDRIAARPAAPEAQGAERVRHVKRGTEYEVLHRGVELQVATPSAAYGAEYVLAEGATLVIYQGEEGNLWACEESEFDDGRFEPAPPASSGQGGR